MENFQLRLRDGRSLEDVKEEAARAVWHVLTSHSEFAELTTNQYDDLRRVLHDVIRAYVHAYDVCGQQAICDEGVEPSEWTPVGRSDAMASDPVWEEHVRRLQLEVPNRLEEFLDDLEGEVFRLLFKNPPERAWLAKTVKPELDDAIKNVFGPYLYRNFACGTCDLCRQRRPLEFDTRWVA